MKLTWKNFAYNIFQMVVLLQICSAVRGQVTMSEVTMSNMEVTMNETDTTNMTSSSNSSMSNVTVDGTGITNMTSSTTSPISNVTITETNTTNMTSSSNSSISNDTASPVTVSQGTTNSTIMSQGSPTSSPNVTVGHQGTSKTSPSSPADNTSTIIIVIVLVAAIIVVIIALITGFCLCCKGDRRQPTGYSSPEMNGKTNGVAKDQPLSDKRMSKEIDTYETVNETDQLEKSSPSVDKPSEKNTNHYVNDGLVTEDEKTYENDTVANKFQLAKDSKPKTGNIFDEIDPTADKDGEQIELSPSESPKRASRSEGEGTLERPKSLTGEQADKERETSVPPTAGLRRNISNRDENLIKLRPKPQPRARPTSRVLQDEDGPAKAPTSSPENTLRDSTGSDPPSPSSQPEKQRLFRPPRIKGKGPDGSDQAALLANVLRKSNTPRQLEEDTDVNKEEGKEEATTYW